MKLFVKDDQRLVCISSKAAKDVIITSNFPCMESREFPLKGGEDLAFGNIKELIDHENELYERAE